MSWGRGRQSRQREAAGGGESGTIPLKCEAHHLWLPISERELELPSSWPGPSRTLLPCPIHPATAPPPAPPYFVACFWALAFSAPSAWNALLFSVRVGPASRGFARPPQHRSLITLCPVALFILFFLTIYR